MTWNRCLLLALVFSAGLSKGEAETRLVPIGKGWARNFVNANILRHNSVVSHEEHQYLAYYAEDQSVILAKRRLGSMNWDVRKTRFKGNVRDAHNTISIMVDGAGYLHMSWDHHNCPLRYCRSVAPGSLEMTDKMPMTGMKEDRVTYPEFYRLPDGDLLFLYRDGRAGNGDLMMNHYDVDTRKWTRRQDAFISGEGELSPYWQMCVDAEGTIHISWVWRAHGGVETNHDMAYAKSEDEGMTWLRSDGQPYVLPITAATAEYAARIPQRHDLINTTSICADAEGRPRIATYWRPEGEEVPQYHVIHHDGSGWRTTQVGRRTMPFTLGGPGTRRLVMSRPRIVVDESTTYMLFRDSERGDRVSVAACDDLCNGEWTFRDLTDFSVGMWEPSYDTEMWTRSRVLHLYVQKVGQRDAEGLEDLPRSEVSVLEWKPQ